MAGNVKVAISSDFLTAFAKLPRNIQGKVTEFINKFRNNPNASGINYEKLKHCADKKICSVRIDDTYRGIVVRQQESGIYLLLWVDHHDEAYAWAMKKRCEVNPKTGAIQVYDMQVETEVSTDENNASENLFGHLTDDDLLLLGVPSVQIAFVRSFETVEAFDEASEYMPKDAYENLTWIIEGIPVQEVLDMYESSDDTVQEGIDPDDLAHALDSDETMKSFVIVEGEDELRQIMAEPLEKWRVFLHPTQRKIVNNKYSGATRVLGGAGTGKTVVAMHRAKALVKQLEGQERILFTTFTANLASDIRDNLRKICTLDEMKKIEVIHLDGWIRHFFQEQGFDAEIIYEDDVVALWEEALLKAGETGEYSQEFYQEEWNRVVMAQEAVAIEKYIRANRTGRGIRLDRKKRIEIWKVFEIYQDLMRDKKVRDINTAMFECANLFKASPLKNRYKHVIVDEGQDFSDNAYRLIRALAGDEHANDLFIVGDSHQRIYKNHPVLSKCGISIRGRSSILRINYRTTEEIRKYAFAFLNGISFDDLDASTDLDDRCKSLTHGNSPVVETFVDANAENEFVIKQINILQEKGVDLKDICIVTRTKDLVKAYKSQMDEEGFRPYEIKRNKTEDRTHDGIRIATMHRVKGLEFKYVFVVAVNDRIVPLKQAVSVADPVAKEEAITSEKCLLYVALTRAQKGAYVTSYGRKSEFLA